MAEKNKIIWERWKNPSVFSIGDLKRINGLISGETIRDTEGNTKLIDYTENKDGIDDEQKVTMMNGAMIPFDPKTDMSSAYNIWIGHANFNLTPKVVEKISKFPGVEVLKIVSRYRFIIGFGRAFLKTPDGTDLQLLDPATVEFSTLEIRTKISDLVEGLDISEIESEPRNIPVKSGRKEEFWLEYVLPNDEKIIIVSEQNNSEFQHQMELYKEMQSMVGGSLTTYLDK